MFIVIIAAIAAVALAGLAIKAILASRGSDAQISTREYRIGMAIAPVVAALVAWGGWAVARNNLMTFTEFWNGWEVSAVTVPVTCSKNGPCRWEYSCEPHQVPYECGSSDSKGNYQSQTCYRTEWYDCPYVTQETHYVVHTTIGDVTIASYVFPDNPEAHRWKGTWDYASRIPTGTIQNAGTGAPPFWVAALTRCAANRPGPVTLRNSYPNYILASERTLMKEHSSDIADYGSRKLLPPLARSVQAFYHADKVSFVGWQPPNRLVWNEALEHLNANFGRQLQGDLHLVVVKDDSVAKNPERYALALKAHWQDKTAFGHDALAKNGVVVIVGTDDGATVSWSRAFTGMPLGNEKFIVVMRDGLKGLPLTPGGLIGPALSRRDARDVYYPPDGPPGPIQRVLWGLDDPGTKFKRVSMSGKDGQGGYLYLKNEIQPTTGQMWAILLVTFLVCCGVWVWAALHYDPSEGNRRFGRFRY